MLPLPRGLFPGKSAGDSVAPSGREVHEACVLIAASCPVSSEVWPDEVRGSDGNRY